VTERSNRLLTEHRVKPDLSIRVPPGDWRLFVLQLAEIHRGENITVELTRYEHSGERDPREETVELADVPLRTIRLLEGEEGCALAVTVGSPGLEQVFLLRQPSRMLMEQDTCGRERRVRIESHLSCSCLVLWLPRGKRWA
jgi:hypothetical protein